MNVGLRKHFDRFHRVFSAAARVAGLTVLAGTCVWLVAGCSSREAENEAKMTSYSTGENKSDTADLFSVPQDQMSHVQVVAVEKSKVPRTLRLTGAVAYNAFKTTPVFSAVGGPVQEIIAQPGQNVHAGQTLLTVTSPDYSTARSAYLKAVSAYQLRASQRSARTQSHR
jgi:membrane fusion protein, heavy metal efflux system